MDATPPQARGDGFRETYAEARAAFIEAARAAPALTALETWPFEEPGGGPVLGLDDRPARGARGEALAMDVAWFGPRDAPRVLLLSSGTHGAEGLAGSGVQVEAISRIVPRVVGADLAVVMAHALNPWGVSHGTRGDARNIDVMRNFIDFSKPPPRAEPFFEAYLDALAPKSWTMAARLKLDLTLAAAVVRHGFAALRAAVPRGQYDYPLAPFYGGRAPSWSRATFETAVREMIGARAAIAHIDYHTGLGKRGAHVLIAEHSTQGELGERRARDWWGETYRPSVGDAGDGAAFYAPHGALDRAMRDTICADPSVVSAVHEFGVAPPLTTLAAVRGDCWLRRPDARDETLKRAVKRAMRRVFYPDAPGWRRDMARAAFAVQLRAAEGLRAIPV